MTRGPRRLKDDPDFKWETGCDIEDEARVVGTYDLEASRSRLLAAVALLPAVTVGDGVPTVRPGASAWKVAVRPVLSAIGGAMVVAGAYWLGVQSGTDVETVSPLEIEVRPPSPVAPETEVAPTPAARVEPALPILETRTQPAPARSEVAAPSGVADPVPPVEPAAVLAAAEPQIEVSGTSEAPLEPAARPAPTSDLGKELAALRPADAAFDAARFTEARAGYEGYLAAYPKGTMVVEANLRLLTSLQGAGDTAALEALAATLQGEPAFSARREDILRLRAESLVRLDRCEEALLVAAELPSKSATEIRRACRQGGADRWEEPRRELP